VTILPLGGAGRRRARPPRRARLPRAGRSGGAATAERGAACGTRCQLAARARRSNCRRARHRRPWAAPLTAP